MVPQKHYRTWIEIDTKKLRANVSEFLKLIPPHTKCMAVVKSNAYGHGIVGVSRTLATFPEFKKRGWFGVDSIVEAVRLRKEGITLPVLVLGYVVPERIEEASKHKISVTISTFQTLARAAALKKPISAHLKFDTGMHRQGFYMTDIPAILRRLKRAPAITCEGIYTHFASAKDIHNPRETDKQWKLFSDIADIFQACYPRIIRHASASGGTLLFPQTHADLVRIGMGLYGYFPSQESKKQLSRRVRLQPILQWKSIVSEIKTVEKGEGIGYDLSEHLKHKSTIAIIPIGYWHGFDRGLSSIGEVLVRGKRAKVLGRVSMDMIVVDVTGIDGARVGDVVTLIGTDGNEDLWGEEIARHIGTTVYEVLTRINPLIYKIYKDRSSSPSSSS